MEELRVLIADDHPLFRHGIREFLNLAPDIQVIGEAMSGEEVIVKAEALHPDVILMDINMPGVNGIEATRRILHDSPHIRILVVTMFEDDSTVFAAMRAGARGYILKDAEKENILRAIQAVGNGEAIFSPTIATRLIDFFATQASTLPKEIFPSLTNASAKSSNSSRAGGRTPPLRVSSRSAPRRFTTMCQTSSASSRLPTARRPSYARGRQD